MENFYFTFSLRHAVIHRIPNLHNCWVRIIAGDENEARKLMFDTMGDKWAFSYPEDNFKKHANFYPYGEYTTMIVGKPETYIKFNTMTDEEYET